MSESEPPQTRWQALATAADNGHLFLDPEAASACSAACDRYLQKLRDSKAKAVGLADIRGFGDFDSGKQLQTIYSQKAAGGPNNMVDVLQSHIEVVEEMKVVFGKFYTATQSVDGANAADVQAQGPR